LRRLAVSEQEAAQQNPEPGEDEAAVVAGSAENNVCDIAVGALE